MKKSIFKIGSLLILTLFTASVFAQSEEELKAKIEKINKEMQAAMLSGNTTSGLAYYAEDAISLPSYAKMAMGIEEIKKTNEQMMSSGMKITKFETKTQMVSRCEENILEIGTYSMAFTMEGAPGEMSDNGKYLTIWRMQPDGSLKIAVETWNSDTYPAMGM
jgi:ketosteroid isomerase-like protein